MSKARTEDDGVHMTPAPQNNTSLQSSQNTHTNANMADTQPPKLSPNSTKARSLPSTPSQRPHSPSERRSTAASRALREGSPQFLQNATSRTPPIYRRGVPCRYETGMKQARRRVPYTLGPEKLEPDPQAAAKKLSPKEEFRLTRDITDLYENLLPTDESESRRQRLVQKLERLLLQRWPGQDIKVSVFGSTGNKLGTKDSDVDICITTDCKEIEHVCSLADLLARNGMQQVVCVSSAKVPIVKVWDPDLQVACDMNVNNPIALENTELIRSYVAIDERFRPLAMIVKYWAKRRILNDAALGGTLSSYTWICLVINFLQTRKPAILPSLQKAPKLEPRLLNSVNVAFDKDLSKYQNFGKRNTSSLGDLVFQFFHYYGHDLDFEKSAVSVRLGRVVSKSEKAWHLLQDNRLCVEEPFNLGRNLGNTADDTSMRGIHLELRRACDLLAAGDLEQCCQQFVYPQPEPIPRRSETFVQPSIKAPIIPQLPPSTQPPSQLPRQGRNANHKQNKRNQPQNNAHRRASNPAARPSIHLRDLPFQMTPQELQLQQQHQQHLLHDQLFQQYQYLQLQEQELRMQLHKHRSYVASSSQELGSGFSTTGSVDDGQASTISSRTNNSARMSLTAPLSQARFNYNARYLNNGLASSGIVTNPASPLLASAIPDSRRYARRASVNNAAAASTLRAQSQPARVMQPRAGLPYLQQRFEVPVRQVDTAGTRRSSTASMVSDPLTNYLQGRLSHQGTRYDAGRRPVEYIGYYLGQSPALSPFPSSSTISPVPSAAGLAIHHGGLSPKMSTRSSRIPSVSTSPASHYASLANGAAAMTPVTEQGPELPSEPTRHSPAPTRNGPLVVDGSVNSPPRRQPAARPMRASSEEPDVSVTTSEDALIDTPLSSEQMSRDDSLREASLNYASSKHTNGEPMHENEYMSLNGASNTFADGRPFDNSESMAMLRKMQEEQNIRQLTSALAAATINNGILSNGHHRRQEQNQGLGAGIPLAPMTNGHQTMPTSAPTTSQEWQTQGKKKKNKKKNAKGEPLQNESTSNKEQVPEDEAMRKGG